MPAAAINDAAPIAVSVVVPTWGRLDQLDSCLDALSRQTLAPERFEIVIVDDEPDHNTLHLVSRWRTHGCARGPRLTCFANSGLHGVAAARNCGWRIARAEQVQVTQPLRPPPWDASISDLRHSIGQALLFKLAVFWRLTGALRYRVRFA